LLDIRVKKKKSILHPSINIIWLNLLEPTVEIWQFAVLFDFLKSGELGPFFPLKKSVV
jgi:hypothetical protein